MAGKLSVDLSLNAKGYVKGAQDASYATKTLKQDTDAYIKEYGTLNKQMRAASTEAKNLAAQFYSLSDAEKNSDIGKQLELQMNQAIQKAGSLKDVMGDTMQRINHAASDTAGLDATIMAFQGAAAATSVYTGALSLLGIQDEELEKQFAKVQGALTLLNGIQSIANVLNKDSVLIGKIKDMQSKMRTASLIKETAAEATNTATEVANTTAAVANTTSKTANTASNVANAGSVTANTVAVAANTTAVAANATALGGATIAQRAFNLAAKANPYVLLATAVLAVVGALYAFSKGSKDAKISEEQLNRELKYTQDEMQGIEDKADFDVAIAQAANKSASEIYKIRLEAKRAKQALAELGLSRATERYFNGEVDKSEVDKWQEEVNKSFADTNKTIMDNYRQTQIDKVKKLHGTGSKSGGKNVVKVEYEPGSIADIEAQIQKLNENQRNKVNPLSREAYEKELARLQKLLKEKKLEAGLEVEVTYKDYSTNWFKQKKEELQKQLDGLEIGSEAYRNIQQQIKDLELTEVNLKASLNAEEIHKSMQKITSDALKVDEEKPDFSYLSDAMQKEANSLQTQIDRVKNGIEQLTEIMDNPDVDLTTLDAATKQYTILSDVLSKLIAKRAEYSTQNEGLKTQKEQIDNIAKASNIAGEQLQNFGSLLSSLGDATDDKGAKAAAIVVEALATLALSFAKAMNSTRTWYEWLAFGITGTAALINMSSQIKSLSSGYAEGGIISGSSFHGDNVLARVNSGEMIINQRQQRNLFDAIDQNKLGGGSTRVEVFGKIRGTDILLVGKNQNNINKLTGTSITWG